MQAPRETLGSFSVEVDEQGRYCGEDADDVFVPLLLRGGDPRGARPFWLQPADR
jgi:hypothetical protein